MYFERLFRSKLSIQMSSSEAFIAAARIGNQEGVKSALDALEGSGPAAQRAFVNAVDETGHNAMTAACLNGHLSVAVLILDKMDTKVDLEVPTTDGKTPLACAALSGNLPLVLKLIQKGANLWYKCPDGSSVFVNYCRGKDNKDPTQALFEKNLLAIQAMKREQEKLLNKTLALPGIKNSTFCVRCLRSNFPFEKLMTCRCDGATDKAGKVLVRKYCCHECKQGDWVSGHYKECYTIQQATYNEQHKFRKIHKEKEAIASIDFKARLRKGGRNCDLVEWVGITPDVVIYKPRKKGAKKARDDEDGSPSFR